MCAIFQKLFSMAQKYCVMVLRISGLFSVICNLTGSKFSLQQKNLFCYSLWHIQQMIKKSLYDELGGIRQAIQLNDVVGSSFNFSTLDNDIIYLCDRKKCLLVDV